jgi:ArsR family transcriptional regulator, arsenate/arsenite/antimonite-responsive transcriptional repressor
MKHEARIFRSLADETRLSMLCLLMQHEELCVCDFMEVLEITQSKASRHLRSLYNSGWVNDRREGLKMKYRLSLPHGAMRARQIQVLAEVMTSHPEALALRGRLSLWLANEPHGKGKKENIRPGTRLGA